MRLIIKLCVVLMNGLCTLGQMFEYDFCDLPCPPGYKCNYKLQDCFDPPCFLVPSCIRSVIDMCGGCQNGQVCVNTGLLCRSPPCQTYRCVVPKLDLCEGCPAGHQCQVIYPPCPPPPYCRVPCIAPPCPPKPRCMPVQKPATLLAGCPLVERATYSECGSAIFFIRQCGSDHDCDIHSNQRCCPSACNGRQCRNVYLES